MFHLWTLQLQLGKIRLRDYVDLASAMADEVAAAIAASEALGR
jgi:hypothetical protein